MVKRAFAKLLVFLALLYTTVTVVGQVMAPIWTSWNNNNTFTGLYKVPENTIQIACVGTSCMTNGLSPMELYGNFGYCAYNILDEDTCPLYPKIAIPNVAFYAELYRAGYKQRQSKETCIDHLRHKDSHHYKVKNTTMSENVKNYLLEQRKDLCEKGFK